MTFRSIGEIAAHMIEREPLVIEDPIGRFAPPHGLRCKCGQIESRAELFHRILRNGSSQYRLRCVECGESGGYCAPHSALSAAEMIAARTDARPTDGKACCRCGNDGGEDHHTAPSAAFGEDAGTWPIIRLCLACHAQWHATMDAYYRRRFSR